MSTKCVPRPDGTPCIYPEQPRSGIIGLDLVQFRQRDTRKRGSVEFIRAAMKNMKQFGVHRDLESYRALVDILPKGKMVAVNIWQKAFFFYPKQQDCITEVLCQMEENRIIPDEGKIKITYMLLSHLV